MSLLPMERAGRRELQVGQPHLDHQEGDGEANPGNYFQVHDVRRSSQHRFTKRKTYLTNFINLYNEMIG